MRLLLDENLPKRLKLDFPEHEIYTVRDKLWNGIKNGELLKLLLDNSFDALLTYDKKLAASTELFKIYDNRFCFESANKSVHRTNRLSSKIKEHLTSGKMPGGPVIISNE